MQRRPCWRPVDYALLKLLYNIVHGGSISDVLTMLHVADKI